MSSLIISCSLGSKERSENQQYRVLLPWGNPDQFSFQVVTLHTLQNITSLKGSVAAFSMGYLGPDVRVRVLEREDGVFVPTDSTSQQMLSLYAHLEKLRELDDVAGSGDVVKRPFTVGVKVKMTIQGEAQQTENNALYSPKHTALFFAPFNSPTLPMTVNAGIIGHEYFHAIFDQMVLQPLRQTMPVELYGESAAAPHESKSDPPVFNPHCPGDREAGKVATPDQLREVHNIRVLRGMNEGLADLWGWIYSNDTNFVGRSIPLHANFRRLDSTRGPVTAHIQFLAASNATGVCGRSSGQGYVYELGSQYAFWLKTAFRDIERETLAKVVIGVLPEIGKLGALAKKEYLKPAILMELFAKRVQDVKPEICREILSRTYRADATEVVTCGGGQ